MNLEHLREKLENHQIGIYFFAVVVATILALSVKGTSLLEIAINPALALMLFVTFLQVPMAALRRAFMQIRFLVALFTVNFIIVPILVFVLVQFLPSDPMVRLGVFLVLLTPCIDYVVTFSHLGRGDAHLLLASTPTLLVLQMLLLPIYLEIFMGDAAAKLVTFGPFIHAFIWLILVPLSVAILVQLAAAYCQLGKHATRILGIFPVPATALVLFIVTAAMIPRLSTAIYSVLQVLPIYIAFAILAPLVGWLIARALRVDVPGSRSIAFSAATRNSLVVLPLALTVPGAIPVLPGIIVAQTLVELGSELLYIRLIAKLGSNETVAS